MWINWNTLVMGEEMYNDEISQEFKMQLSYVLATLPPGIFPKN